MGDDNGAGLLFGGGAVLGIILGFFLGVGIGSSSCESKWRTIAIDRGIAAYNQKTGKLEVIQPGK